MIVVIGVTKKGVLQNRLVVQRLSLNVVMVLVYRDNGDVIESRYLSFVIAIKYKKILSPFPFIQDCDSGEDEKNCNEAVEGSRSCASDEHSCKDGRCIMVMNELN